MRRRGLESIGAALLLCCSACDSDSGNKLGGDAIPPSGVASAGDTDGDDFSGSGVLDGANDTEGPVSDGPAACGDGIVDPDEECDDANVVETDGCLSTCAVARSCAQILAELPGTDDGQYGIVLPSGPLDVYCDMSTDGGGWTLIAKVNPTDQDTLPGSEPVGWFDMSLRAEHLQSPQLVLDGPLASHRGSLFTSLVDANTLARFELIAADDYDLSVAWYKEVLAEGLSSWFDFDDPPSLVCSDLEMTVDCTMGGIAPTGGTNSPTVLGGMALEDFGYPGSFPVHMRLDDDVGAGFSGLCSSTEDLDDNAWPDSYAQHWGNALRIWLR
ncbi:MAG: fibrinogen-like YCDxxxxGGGW domain-containing protein [Nannocystaceae bacterium]